MFSAELLRLMILKGEVRIVVINRLMHIVLLLIIDYHGFLTFDLTGLLRIIDRHVASLDKL